MALTWDLTNVTNYEQTCWVETGETDDQGRPKRLIAPVTEALIYNSMAIGIGVITADNAGEVYARTKVREALKGYKDAPITIDDIAAHVGLVTNVSYESRQDWARRLLIGNGDYLTADGTKLNRDALEDDLDNWDIQADQNITQEHRRRYEEQVTGTVENHTLASSDARAEIVDTSNRSRPTASQEKQ